MDEFGYIKRDVRIIKQINKLSSERGEKLINPKVCPGGDGEGVAKGGGTSMDTGNGYQHQLAQTSSLNSVTCDTPDKPNVITYHLKVNHEPLKNKLESGQRMRTDLLSGHYSSLNQDNEIDNKPKLLSRLSSLSIDKTSDSGFNDYNDLPLMFQVKYLGSHDARGLWGIKHTRKPVDNMVAGAKSLPTDKTLPLIKVIVSEDGVTLIPIGLSKCKFKTNDFNHSKTYPIETISYGVQDLIYTRVFSMIVVRDTVNFRQTSPFECHAFVCESKHHARQLTCALANAFQIYSNNVKSKNYHQNKKQFAIDLRTPDEIENELSRDSEA